LTAVSERYGDFAPIGVMLAGLSVLRGLRMQKRKLGTLSLVLVLTTALLAVAQETVGDVERGIPAGWVNAPSSRDAPALWQCAGYGGSWVVSKNQDAIAIKKLNIEKQNQVPLPRQLKLSKEMIGRRSMLHTGDGWLIGFDAGEFGGGLWWFSSDGTEAKKLLEQNVHSIYETPDGVFVLAGLAHLGIDQGEIDQFTATPEKISLKYKASLGGSPEASALGPEGEIIIATMRSVLLVDHGGKVHELYRSGENLTYPTSVVEKANGDIFVAMRFFVLRLISDNGAYRADWLMPKKCQSFKMVKYICNCMAPN
jgi:hypothetical protein